MSEFADNPRRGAEDEIPNFDPDDAAVLLAEELRSTDSALHRAVAMLVINDSKKNKEMKFQTETGVETKKQAELTNGRVNKHDQLLADLLSRENARYLAEQEAKRQANDPIFRWVAMLHKWWPLVVSVAAFIWVIVNPFLSAYANHLVDEKYRIFPTQMPKP